MSVSAILTPLSCPHNARTFGWMISQASLEQKSNAIVAEYGEGDSFGELALLYNSPRAATVTCKEGGRVWALERKRFRYVRHLTGMSALHAHS